MEFTAASSVHRNSANEKAAAFTPRSPRGSPDGARQASLSRFSMERATPEKERMNDCPFGIEVILSPRKED